VESRGRRRFGIGSAIYKPGDTVNIVAAKAAAVIRCREQA
jgi:hypothetical protein